MKLSEAEISEIVQLLRDADCDDLELEWDDIYFRIARRSALGDSALLQQPSIAISGRPASEPQTIQAAQPSGAVQPAASQVVPAAAPPDMFEVRSSLMGTVYRAPQPGDPAFVEVGSRVQPGDTLCLLEVMKVFTALKAEIAGIVERVLIKDGDLVEYGQAIIWIRPT